MEVKTALRTIQVDYVCPNCEIGLLITVKEFQFRNPAVYIHKCDKCNRSYKLNKSYPYYEYEVINAKKK
jgi:ribosomal protein L37AE/L43A